MKLNFHIIAYAALGEGLSGGDRIFIELARRWAKDHSVKIYVWKEGLKLCQRQNLYQGVEYKILTLGVLCNLGFFICYISRIIAGTIKSFFIHLEESQTTVVYSASEFWMDCFPALVLKLRYPKIKWVAAWFQTAPNPLKGFTQGERQTVYRFSALLYWLVQLPVKPLIARFADLVLVNNQAELAQFPKLAKNNKLFVFIGAVDVEAIKNYQRENKISQKKYEAVFQGRFHPQKGVEELIEIWKQVILVNPQAKLAMIGDGPLMKAVRLKIKHANLEKSVKLFGYLFDGPEKYQLFSEAKLVVHPAFYDSGGMAAAEAMAFGLPCVAFDLESYQSYYPQGMIKVKIGDLIGFSEAINQLLQNPRLRNKIGTEAKQMVEGGWSWDKRASDLLKRLS